MVTADTSIYNNINPPQRPSILDIYAKAQGVKNLIAQQQLQQQDLQVGAEKLKQDQIQNTERERASEAQKKLGELLASNTTVDQQGVSTVNHGAVIQGLAQAGHGKEAVAYDVQRRADQKSAIEDEKNKLANIKARTDLIGNASQSLLGIKDDQQMAAQYDQQRAEMIQQGVVSEQQAPPSSSFAEPGSLRQYITQHAGAAVEANKQIENRQKDLDYAQKLVEFRQKVLTEAPKTAKDWTAYASQLVSAADNQDHLDAAMHNLTEAGVPMNVRSLFSKKYSKEAQAQAAQVGLTPKDRQEAADRAATLNAPSKPAVALPPDVEAQHIRIGNATRAPQGPATSTLPGLENVPAHLAAPAAAAFSKSAVAYADAKSTADEIQGVIDLVRSGNKAAGSNLPLLGVGALNAINGIKRMNSAEINQYQGAGSLWDRVTGEVGKLAAGQPIPADVLDDIEQLHKKLAEGAIKKHSAEVQAINASHGSTFKPIQIGAAAATATHRYNPATRTIEAIK